MARSRSAPPRDDTQFLAWLLLLAALLALPAVLLGALLQQPIRRSSERVVVRLLALGLAVAGALALYLLRDQLQDLAYDLRATVRRHDWDGLVPLLGRSWLMTAPAAPPVALLLAMTARPDATALIQREQRAEQGRAERGRRRATEHAPHAPDEVEGSLVLGALVGGDLHAWQRGRWLLYPAPVLQRHAVVVGASASGKTETLLRLAQLAATVYGWQVLYVDAKGDPATAARFLAAMQDARLQSVPLFPRLAYNGWRGDGQAITNRLLAVETFSEPYYADVAALTLNLAVNAPGGLPRSSTELLERLDRAVLTELYAGQAGAEQLGRLRAEDVRGVYTRYAGFFAAVHDQLDGGWTLEDADAAYLLLQGTARKHEAACLGRFLTEEIADYVTERKPAGRQVLVIIDEFSALRLAADAAGLFERIRSFGAAVVVSSQSYAGLGPEAERIIGAAATVITHQCSDPERLTGRAGLRERLEWSYQLPERGRAAERRTVRSGTAARVDPDTVRQLRPGEAVVIAEGHAARVQVARLVVDAQAGQALVAQGGTLVRKAVPIEVVMREQAARQQAAQAASLTVAVQRQRQGRPAQQVETVEATPDVPVQAKTVEATPDEPAQAETLVAEQTDEPAQAETGEVTPPLLDPDSDAQARESQPTTQPRDQTEDL